MKIFFFKNKIKFLIPFDNNYYKFHFYDNSTPITFNSPLPNTYLKIDTLSIDCSIQLRWCLWGSELFFGMKNFFNYHLTQNSNHIQFNEYFQNPENCLENFYPNSIQKFPKLKKQPTQLFLNDELMENEENFLNLMLEWDKILDSSDESELDFEVLFTLKLNLDQYLLLASKVLIPGFIKNKDNKKL